MRHLAVTLGLSLLCQSTLLAQNQQTQQQAIPNPAIDAEGHARVSQEALRHRESRRLSEEDFIKISREKGVIVLDARGKEKFDLLHVKGATHLSFPDITVESIKKLAPDKTARILIYCNNNFVGAEDAFPTKAVTVPLNLSTYTTLYAYGYRNVYELGPQLDPKTCKLPLESTPAKR